MINLLISLLCLAILIYASEHFIDQSVSLAKKFKVGTFIVGFVILAFGTSLPEFVSSTYATFSGHPQFAISNVIGSNLANVCLILGVLPLIAKFKLRKEDVHFNIPLSFVSTLFFTLVIYLNGYVMTPILGVIFLLVFCFLLFLFNKNNMVSVSSKVKKFNSIYFFLSLIALVISGKYLVENIIHFSRDTGISESNLGFFVTAIGTSIPEFVTTIVALKKGNEQLGMGNILGSNLFNTFFILSISSQIMPLDFKPFMIDLIIMSIALLMIVVASFIGKKFFFSKKEGLVMMLLYFLFVIIQINMW